MATYEQIPGVLDISVGMGDDLSLLLDFDVVLTGYTFVAYVKPSGGGADVALSVTNTNLAAGQITVVATDAIVTALGVGAHRWWLTWTLSGTSRRILAGDFKVVDYA